MSKKLLGLRVSRTGSEHCRPSTHDIWVGFTDAELELRKAFILERVSDPKFDGETTFERIESDVLIDKPGLYLTGRGGRVRIAVVGSVSAWGYRQKRNARGKWVDTTIAHFYVNGYTNQRDCDSRDYLLHKAEETAA